MADLQEHFHRPLSAQAYHQFNQLQANLATIQLHDSPANGLILGEQLLLKEDV
jgi:hypothetical protein